MSSNDKDQPKKTEIKDLGSAASDELSAEQLEDASGGMRASIIIKGPSGPCKNTGGCDSLVVTTPGNKTLTVEI